MRTQHPAILVSLVLIASACAGPVSDPTASPLSPAAGTVSEVTQVPKQVVNGRVIHLARDDQGSRAMVSVLAVDGAAPGAAAVDCANENRRPNGHVTCRVYVDSLDFDESSRVDGLACWVAVASLGPGEGPLREPSLDDIPLDECPSQVERPREQYTAPEVIDFSSLLPAAPLAGVTGQRHADPTFIQQVTHPPMCGQGGEAEHQQLFGDEAVLDAYELNDGARRTQLFIAAGAFPGIGTAAAYRMFLAAFEQCPDVRGGEWSASRYTPHGMSFYASGSGGDGGEITLILEVALVELDDGWVIVRHKFESDEAFDVPHVDMAELVTALVTQR